MDFLPRRCAVDGFLAGRAPDTTLPDGNIWGPGFFASATPGGGRVSFGDVVAGTRFCADFGIRDCGTFVGAHFAETRAIPRDMSYPRGAIYINIYSAVSEASGG